MQRAAACRYRSSLKLSREYIQQEDRSRRGLKNKVYRWENARNPASTRATWRTNTFSRCHRSIGQDIQYCYCTVLCIDTAYGQVSRYYLQKTPRMMNYLVRVTSHTHSPPIIRGLSSTHMLAMEQSPFARRRHDEATATTSPAVWIWDKGEEERRTSAAQTRGRFQPVEIRQTDQSLSRRRRGRLRVREREKERGGGAG